MAERLRFMAILFSSGGFILQQVQDERMRGRL